VDKESIEEIEKRGTDKFLRELQEELKEKRYKALAVRRVYIPKPNNKKRPLGIPAIRDRVVQMAVVLIIEPIFEAVFCEDSYGFRPKKSAHQAVRKIAQMLNSGGKEVIDIDIKGYYDNIPHDKLLYLVSQKIADKNIMRLINGWLKADIMEEGNIRKNTIGTPQGGVISPLLANIYLNVLDTYWEKQKNKGLKAELIRYADDMVIIAKQGIDVANKHLEKVIGRLELEINKEKTKIIKIAEEGFDFLGFHLCRYGIRTGQRRWY
jgi:group II intron reverse transcriptase/maturase